MLQSCALGCLNSSQANLISVVIVTLFDFACTCSATPAVHHARVPAATNGRLLSNCVVTFIFSSKSPVYKFQ